MFETEIPPKREPSGSAGAALYVAVSGLLVGFGLIAGYFWRHNLNQVIEGTFLFVVGFVALLDWRKLMARPMERATLFSNGKNKIRSISETHSWPIKR